MFAYCGNNPVNAIDYTGEQECVFIDRDFGGCGGGGGIVTLWLIGVIIDFLTPSPDPAPHDTTSEAGAQASPHTEAKAIAGTTPATPPDPNKKNNPTNTSGTGKAPKQGEPGSTYTQISSDGNNQIVSQTTYNEHGLPAQRIDFIGKAHGNINTPHIHIFSWTEIDGIWYPFGKPIVLPYIG